MATKKKTKPYIDVYLNEVANNAKDTSNFILYSRDGDIQGVVSSLPYSGETIIHLDEGHNNRISLKTLEKWVKQARKYDNKMNKVLASADKASSILASAKKTTQSAKKK